VRLRLQRHRLAAAAAQLLSSHRLPHPSLLQMPVAGAGVALRTRPHLLLSPRRLRFPM
jgi:hypothetical protein